MDLRGRRWSLILLFMFCAAAGIHGHFTLRLLFSGGFTLRLPNHTSLHVQKPNKTVCPRNVPSMKLATMPRKLCPLLLVQMSADRTSSSPFCSRSCSLASISSRACGMSVSPLFTEVPHDITTHSGQDVEMACSFRGAGPSYSLEIQWWYMKNNRDWPEKPAWTSNQVVKVAGSNISHKLRLSSVKRSDEGMYECRVIDFSGSVAQHHHIRAYLQVEAERRLGHGSADSQPKEPRQKGQGSQVHPHKTEGRELKRRSADDSTTDCTESCVL
ncbi:hypothetical protein J4Q44_G00108330 [Coregonus suidteri]|uniref:Ig-like domain-containing protein n=1 Tax=Coregonus suidteri TaxID=861788 RepID=A0AAN8M220_9TELE